MSPLNADAFQHMLQQLRTAFLDEMPEKLDRLDQLLVAMEESGASSDTFNELYRIVHSLKGSGGTFGLHIFTTICHQLEDLLNTTQGGTKYPPELISISLDYVDLLRAALEEAQAGMTSFPQIDERLEALRKRLVKKQFSVLIVGNSKLLTQISLQALADFPVRPVIVADGYIALMRALTEPFDLLITDHELPVLSGLALIGALRLSNSNNHNMQTILITQKQNIKTNRKTDANYVIIKDKDLAENLIELTKRALASIQ